MTEQLVGVVPIAVENVTPTDVDAEIVQTPARIEGKGIGVGVGTDGVIVLIQLGS